MTNGSKKQEYTIEFGTWFPIESTVFPKVKTNVSMESEEVVCNDR